MNIGLLPSKRVCVDEYGPVNFIRGSVSMNMGLLTLKEGLYPRIWVCRLSSLKGVFVDENGFVNFKRRSVSTNMGLSSSKRVCIPKIYGSVYII